MMNDKSSAGSFCQDAQHYCTWCESLNGHMGRVAIQSLMAIIGSCFIKAISLQTTEFVEPAIEDSTGSRVQQLAKKLDFSALPVQFYRDLFDDSPESDEEPTLGDLYDDLTDIYLELKHGLVLWEAGYFSEAESHWALSYRAHWGRHAVCALKVLFSVRQDAPPVQA
jgi:Domain of unknown function (DUF5063)